MSGASINWHFRDRLWLCRQISDIFWRSACLYISTRLGYVVACEPTGIAGRIRRLLCLDSIPLRSVGVHYLPANMLALIWNLPPCGFHLDTNAYIAEFWVKYCMCCHRRAWRHENRWSFLRNLKFVFKGGTWKWGKKGQMALFMAKVDCKKCL